MDLSKKGHEGPVYQNCKTLKNLKMLPAGEKPHFLFMNWYDQYFLNDRVPKAIYNFKTININTPNQFSFLIESKSPRKPKIILTKTIARGITIPNLKGSYRTIVIKTARYRQHQTDWSVQYKGGPRFKSAHCRHLILEIKSHKQTVKAAYSTNGADETG